MDPERPLLAWRLVQVTALEAGDAFVSAASRAIQPTLDLLSVVCGRGQLAPALRKAARLRLGPASLDDLTLDGDQRAALGQLCAEARATLAGAEAPWLALVGPEGIGKRELAERWAAHAGRPVLAFDPRVPAKGQGDELLRRAQREALLHGAVLYIGPLAGDALGSGLQEMARQLADHPGAVVLGVEATETPPLHLGHAVREVVLRMPGAAARQELWERHVPEEQRAPGLDLGALARAYHLGPGEIAEVAAEVRAVVRARPLPLVAEDELRRGVERRLRNGLGQLARRLDITARWEDVVLPADDLERLEEFIGRGLHAEQVYGEWGFGRRVGYGKAMIALLSGPPGTGKTMLAGLIAKALDLSIYQIDLSQVMSRWVGETEKQLAKVFDQAERAHAVLLFDEADALLAKRTEVKQANDRYGNLAVNYLLQRLEQYSGVAILTTNKESALDEALQRRLSLHLRLDVPEAPERERLWRSLLPTEAPCARGIDFRELADRYELTGGYIKNAVVRAAFLAAAARRPLHMTLLHRAAALELEDMGRLVMRTREPLARRQRAA